MASAPREAPRIAPITVKNVKLRKSMMDRGVAKISPFTPSRPIDMLSTEGDVSSFRLCLKE